MARAGGRSTAVGLVFVSMTLLGWTSVPLFLRYFADYIDAWTANGWRYGLSALIWAPVVIVGALRGTLPRGLWRAAVVPSIFNCLGQVCFAWAPYYIGPGLLSFLLRLQIVVITIGAYLLFPEERRLLRTRGYWLGILAVFGGSMGTILLGAELPRGGSALGVALGLGAGALYACYALAVRQRMRRFGSIESFAAISQYTAAGMVAIMLLVGRDHGGQVLSLSHQHMLLLAVSAVLGIALGHVFYYASIARLGVTTTAGTILLLPFIVGVSSYFIFGERLTGWQWTSGAMAIIGAAIILHTQATLARSRVGADVSAREP